MALKTLLCSCVVLLVLCAFLSVDAKVASAHVTGGQFAYLNKFCFGFGIGTLNYTISSKADATNLYLIFIDDQAGNWSAVYKHSLTCEQIIEKAGDSLPVKVTPNQPSEVRFKDTQRPHFWYVSALNCNGTIDLNYDFTFLQGSTSVWVRQFSYDEQGLEGLYLFYFIFFILAAVVHGYAIWSYMQTGSYHLLVKLYTITVALEGVSIFSLFIHYAAYSSNGVGVPFFKGLGEFLDICAQLTFILLIVLIAKGWCISKTMIDDRLIVMVGLGVLSVLYLSMFIWSYAGLDPASTIYIYESAPGIIIIVARAVAMLWFAWSMRTTYLEENNAAKRKFYLWFGIAFLVWFLALPFITSVAAGLDPWMRLKTVMSLYVTFNIVFLVVLGVLLWPSRASEYFQITTRSSIGSMPYDAI